MDLETAPPVPAALAALHLDLRYDIEADRLLLTARSDERGIDFHLTRRMTRHLLSGTLDLMMKTSDVVARSGPDHRADVLLFEHTSALEVTPGPTPTPPAIMQAQVQAALLPVLARRVDIELNREGMKLSLWGATHLEAWIHLARGQGHQLIDMLLLKVREAEWDLAELSWMDRRGQYIRPQGTPLA